MSAMLSSGLARLGLAHACVVLLSLTAARVAAQQAMPVPAPETWTHAHAAPKGGTINLRNPDRRSSFDKFNPFTTKGNAPAGLSIFMFESLAVLGSDESIRCRLHPKARFTNGDAVTAAVVRHSFEAMSGKFAAPGLRG
jgi:microcin C transport system substrate-binding protein